MRGRPASQRTMVVDGRPLPEALDEALIRAVVHAFYDDVRRDPLLGPVFDARIAPEEWPHHLAKLCDFWSATLLRTGRYAGRPLPPHRRCGPTAQQSPIRTSCPTSGLQRPW